MSRFNRNTLCAYCRTLSRSAAIYTIAVLVTSFVAVAPARDNSSLALQRWAILSSKDVQQMGISDMLTAALSKINDFQLVERDQLELTISELELANLMGSQSPAGRLRFGRQLKADALLFVKLEQREQHSFLQMLVSDTHYGARLFSDYLPIDIARPDKAASTLTGRVRDVRQRFAAGVEHIIGVSRFISDNLPIKYDHLQAAYARLLESALMELPGVAVIEIEEGRAIGRELDLVGEKIHERVVPVFLEGKFQVHESGIGSPLRISFTIDIKSAKGVTRTLRSGDQLEAEAASWLIKNVPAEIAKPADERQPLNLKQQAAILAARSEAFEDLGDVHYAAELREATLLAMPDDPEQELALIGLCFRKLTPFGMPSAYTESRRRAIDEYYRQRQKSPNRALAEWRHIADRVERIVGRRVMNAREAAVLVHATLDTFGTHVSPQRVREYDPAREFIARAYPLLRQLDPRIAQGRIRKSVSRAFPYFTHIFYKNSVGLESFDNPHSAEEQYDEWTGQAVDDILRVDSSIPVMRVTSPWSGPAQKPPTLNQLGWFLTTVADPKRPPISAMAELILQERGRYSIYQGPFESGEAARLYEQLEKSGSAINVFYALCGRAALGVLRPEAGRISRDAVALIDRASDRCKQLGYDKAPYPHAKFPGGISAFQTQLIALRGKAERMLTEAAQPVAPMVTGRKRHRLPELSLRPADRGRRITFHPIAEVKADWPRLMSCGDQFDVMWSPQRLAVMLKKGIVEELLTAEVEDAIEGAAWDGRNLWVARRKTGITLIAELLTTRSLIRIDAQQGLPDYEPLGPPAAHLPPYGVKPSLQLHAIAPGKCLVVGQLGQYGRQWIALISEQDKSGADRFRSQVFYTATKVTRVGGGTGGKLDRIASLGAFLELAEPSAVKTMLILPRQMSEVAVKSDDPLVIDAGALKASIQPGLFPKLRAVADPSPVAVGRRVFQLNPAWYEITAHWPEVSSGKSTWRTKTFHEFNAGHNVNAKPWEKTEGGFALLVSNGKVYSPGSHWHRLDPQTLELECLNQLRLPQNHDYQRYAISAHYGMVAWSNEDNFTDAWTEKHRLFRVVIDGSEPEPIAATYSFVPAEKRDAHHQAVEALRAKGASVSSNTIEFVNTVETGVQLDEHWIGTDQDLRQLASLNRLVAVNLVRAPVTNEGIREIGKLTQLRRLWLAETQVTDAGVAHLAKLGQLTELWLEGTFEGREFSAACLSHLKSLPNLQGLTLYGPGFTDAAVVQLGEFGGLRRLTLIGTAVTAQGVRTLREQKRGTPANRTSFYMGPTGVFVEP